MLGKIHENSHLSKNFLNIIGPEEDFFVQIKSENYKQPLLSLLEFMCECLENPSKTQASQLNLGFLKDQEPLKSHANYSSMGDDDYHKLIEESDNLAKTIASQKYKISQICNKVKESIGESKNIIDPLKQRPASCFENYKRDYAPSPNFAHNVIIEEKDEEKSNM